MSQIVQLKGATSIVRQATSERRFISPTCRQLERLDVKPSAGDNCAPKKVGCSIGLFDLTPLLPLCVQIVQGTRSLAAGPLPVPTVPLRWIAVSRLNQKPDGHIFPNVEMFFQTWDTPDFEPMAGFVISEHLLDFGLWQVPVWLGSCKLTLPTRAPI